MKKTICLMIISLVILSLFVVGCGSNEPEEPEPIDEEQVEEIDTITETTVEEAEAFDVNDPELLKIIKGGNIGDLFAGVDRNEFATVLKEAAPKEITSEEAESLGFKRGLQGGRKIMAADVWYTEFWLNEPDGVSDYAMRVYSLPESKVVGVTIRKPKEDLWTSTDDEIRTIFLNDDKLYDYIRNIRSYDAVIDQEAFDKYGQVAQEAVEETIDRYEMFYDGLITYNLERFVKIWEGEIGKTDCLIYKYDYSIKADINKLNIGNIYFDCNERIQGKGQSGLLGCVVVKLEDGKEIETKAFIGESPIASGKGKAVFDESLASKELKKYLGIKEGQGMQTAIKKLLLEKKTSEIRVSYSTSKKALPIGASKIGGCPSVPDGFSWPYYEYEDEDTGDKVSKPLSFLMQFDLKEMSKFEEASDLPKSGTLAFFYELGSMKWGFDPKDKGCARVFYFKESEKLHSAEIPEDLEEEYVLPEQAIKTKPHASIPSYEELTVSKDWEALTEKYPDAEFIDMYDDYFEIAKKAGYDFEEDEMGDITKLFGWPNVIQDPMEEECEAVTQGYYTGDLWPEELNDNEDFQRSAKEWKLLLQVGTIETDEDEFMWGDCGHLYFWIKDADLKAENFDNCWLILQCG
ncbi:MAG: DUF1963 domain-containing protein [Clostridiales bacterium]|nr:DUF1963 domain-containing protein [Clostridiales bacterium]